MYFASQNGERKDKEHLFFYLNQLQHPWQDSDRLT